MKITTQKTKDEEWKNTKTTAKMVFKVLKACRFDFRRLKSFDFTDEEKRCFNKVYGKHYGEL